MKGFDLSREPRESRRSGIKGCRGLSWSRVGDRVVGGESRTPPGFRSRVISLE